MTRRKRNIPQPEQLEQRLLLTVKVDFNPNSGLLKINGDNADNRIDIDNLDFGEMEVFADTELVGTFDNVKSIRVKLKGGDDRLLINSIRISGGLTANLGSGADEFDIDSFINFGTGTNGAVYFGGPVNVNFGGDLGDLLDLDDAIRFVGDASFKGVSDVIMQGDGTSYVPNLNNDIFFDQNLTITFGKPSDLSGDNREIYLESVVVEGTAKFTGTSAVERYVSITSNFENFQIDLSGENDVFFITTSTANQNRYGSAVFNAGSGDDTMFTLDQIFDSSPTFISIENIFSI